jgi:ribosome maturation factor RimP
LLGARLSVLVGSRPLFLLRASLSWEASDGMAAGNIEQRVNEIAQRVADDSNVELVHVEIAGPENGPIVRVFIDKPEGVTHEDCANMSLHLGTILDVEDFIHSAYTLEVSSPGIERGLYRLQDYERFAGQLAKMKTRLAINGQRNFRGRIIGVEENEVIFDDKTNGKVRIPFDSIARANLEIDVEEEFRRAKEREAAEAHNGTSNHN